MIANPNPNEPKKPKKPKKPFRMTPAYSILLHGTSDMPIGLLHLQMARAEQLCRPHYSMKSVKAVKAKLCTLEEAGYVEVDAIPTKFAKSPYIYMLTKKGINYLAEAGQDVNTAYRPDKDTNRQALFISHTLEVNDVIVAAAMLRKVDPNYWLESFVHERVMKRQPYLVSWKGEEIRLIPDGILTFHYRIGEKKFQTPVMLEHESSEKGQFAFRRKVRAYIVLLKEKFREHGIAIAYTTTLGPNYLGKMREWTWQELHSTSEPEDLGKLFLFASVDKPIDPERLWLEPVWYTPYDEPPVALLGV